MSNIIRLDFNTPSVQYLCQKDKRLEKVINMVGPISYVPHLDSAYSFLIHEIIEQMLSIKAGQKIYQRLENICNNNITPTQVKALSYEQLRNIGISNSKTKCICEITDALVTGSLSLKKLESLSDEEVLCALTKFHGIGKWTAKMYLIFVLDRPDILPSEDGAFLQVYRWLYKTDDCSESNVIRKCRKWKPYSSIGSRFFYKALDTGITKKEFHLYKGGLANG